MNPEAYLDHLLAGIPRIRPSARSVRAVGQNVLCARRAILEAAGRANLRELAKACGGLTDPEPSLFAIQRGDRHEDAVMRPDGHLLRLLRDELDLPIEECSMIDLRAITPGVGLANLRRRHLLTRRVLRQILEGHADAPNIIRGAILRLEFAGVEMFIEPDAVITVFAAGRIFVLEIKSFAAIDGKVPARKAAPSASQTALYIFATRNEVRQLGFDPEVVSTTGYLITATNASLWPSIHPMDLGADARRVGRDLERLASAHEVLADLMSADPDGTVSAFDAAALGEPCDAGVQEAQRHNRDVLSRIPARFVPDCLTSCPLGDVCRDEMRARGLLESYGSEHARVAGSVDTTRRLVALASGETPEGEDEREVAERVRTAAKLMAAAGYPLVPASGKAR